MDTIQLAGLIIAIGAIAGFAVWVLWLALSK